MHTFEARAMSGERVLVVEDEFLIRLALSDGLRMCGFQVITAENGDEALAFLEQEPFDLVITDVKMPGSLDGVELTHKLQRERPDIKVLVVSGHSTGNRLPPQVPLVRKPYSIRELVKIANSLLAFG